MSASDVKKRLYVGGLTQNVTEDELKKRFELFLTVSNVNLKSQTDAEGNYIKTFAHLSVEGTEAGLKKCYNAYQNAKWKGSVMKIEDAKESFIDRLAVERLEEKNKPAEPASGKSKKKKIDEWKPPEMEKLNVAPVPGTPVPGKKDWVVGKYGRVLPVLNVKKSYVTKPIKHDPSKFCHATKVFKDDVKVDTKMSEVNSENLTWEIDQPDSEITRKRKGDFPSDPKPKKTTPFPAEFLTSSVDEYFSKRQYGKEENSSKKTSDKEVGLSKKSVKEKKLSKKLSGKENGSFSSQCIDSEEEKEDSGDINHSDDDDELEVVKVGGFEQNRSKPMVRSRFDSDYESDGGDDGTNEANNVSNKVNSSRAKSTPKKQSAISVNGVSHKKVKSLPKKQNNSSSSEEDDSDEGKEISEFKGIGSLISKSNQDSKNSNSKKTKLPPVRRKKAVCNEDVGESDEMNNNNDETKSTRNAKRKMEVDCSPQGKISNKKTKQSSVEQESSLKPGYISTLQKDSSQYADLFLSEFVAKAPKNPNQSRQKYDPYDSDLDSDNFEVVAKKLAKKAGVQTTQEDNRKTKENDDHLKTLVSDCSKSNMAQGISSFMRDIAGGYSAKTSTQPESAHPWSWKEKTATTNCQMSTEKQIPISKKKNLTQLATENESKPSSKRTKLDSSIETGMDNTSTVKAKSKASTVKTKADARTVQAKSEDSTPKAKSDASTVKTKSKAEPQIISTKDKKTTSPPKKSAEDSSDESDETGNESEDDSSEDDKKVKRKLSPTKGVVKDKKNASPIKKTSKNCDEDEDSSNGEEDESEGDEDESDSEEDESDEEETKSEDAKNSKGKLSPAKAVIKPEEKVTSSTKSSDDEDDDSNDEDEDNSNDEDEDDNSNQDEDDSNDEHVKDVKGKLSSHKAAIKDNKKASSSPQASEDSDDESDEDEEESSDDSSDDVKDVKEKLSSNNSAVKDIKKAPSPSKKSEDSDESDEESEEDDDESESTDDSNEDVTDAKGKSSSSNIAVKDGKKASSPHKKPEDSDEESSEDDEESSEDDEESGERDEDEDSREAVKDVKGKLSSNNVAGKNIAGPKHVTFNGSDDEATKDSAHEDSEISLAEEKKRNLQVLENVVGKTKVDKLTAKLKRDNVKIMDMNQLRFDPTKLKPQQSQHKESKTKKTVATPDRIVKQEVCPVDNEVGHVKQEVFPVKETQKETPTKDKPPKEKKQKKESSEETIVKSEVTMSDSLMSMLKTEASSGGKKRKDESKSSSFSFLDMFDGQKDKRDEEEAMEIETQPQVKPLSSLPLPSKALNSNEGEILNSKLKNVVDNKMVDTKDKDDKQKEKKDKTQMKKSKNENNSTNSAVKKLERALNKELNAAGRIDVRFTKEEWDKRNFQIRQDMLKICRGRSNYAVRKKRIEDEQEKTKSVRKFGSWKKK